MKNKSKSKWNQALLFALIILVASAGYFVVTKTLSKQAVKKLDYFSIIEHEKKSYTVFEGERLEISFRLKNLGRTAWSSREDNPCLLSYHLLDEHGNNIRFDNRRFPLPHKVKPSQTIEMTVTLRSPLDKGQYILEFDLLKEGIAWFKDYGAKTTKISLFVMEKKWPEDEHNLNLDYGKYTKFHSNRNDVNKLNKLIRLTLNKNEVDFKGQVGNINGFSAGTNYPQIWLRDANTIIPASKYFYSEPFLSSWLEEHLSFQKENGSLEDWINSRGESDKNTTETDQESSAVQAAYKIFALLGPSWLEKHVDGENIINRLEKALDFVLRERFNKEHGLIMGAHTADWGDVDMVDADEKAKYVDERTHWTVDIYDQSMFYQASLNLAAMLDSIGQKEKAFNWRKKAESIKTNSTRWLWQNDKGFYKIHIHLDSLHHDFDEDNIFPMGGNTQAMISGLADEEKCIQIIENALDRQKSFNISTISGTLLPPYPKKFFKHPLLDDPFEYQNGAQWDWFGGKLIYTMFENGFSSLAKEKLTEIIRKNMANNGFFEWDNPEGIGHGSDYFCGSAGSLGKAVYEGYLGIKLRKDSLLIEPKFQEDEAKLHFYIPANDIFVAYDYQFFSEKNKLIFAFNSNFSHPGRIKILSPWQHQKRNAKEKDRASLEVLMNGVKTPFTIERVNQDTFICVETDFQNHIIEIKYKP